MRWISYFNLVLVFSLVCLGIFFIPYASKDQELLTFRPHIERTELPNSLFSQHVDQDLAEGPFALKWVPPQVQLPDLRSEIQFFGQNDRPDSSLKKAYHIGLKRSQEFCSISEGERIYLIYQGHYSSNFIDQMGQRELITPSQTPIWGDTSSSNQGKYIFSPDNQPTPLWVEISPKNERTIAVHINMLDERGALVTTPNEWREITLQAIAFPKSIVTGLKLGKYRVDSTLLVRQKACWIGCDRFLEMHGGDDFSDVIGQERIDFIDNDAPYTCFISPNRFLIWKNEKWTMPLPGEQTEKFPILCAKKIDNKIMNLEFWDIEGRSKTNLTLIRSRNHQNFPDLAQEFKFVGAKTWAQFIVECKNGERITLKPHDWLVLTQDGWTKLNSPELIDEYVDGKLKGPLFVLEKMTKQNGRQVLLGHLFNTSRTEVEEVEIESSTNTPLANYYRTIPLKPPIKPKLEGHKQ